MPFEKDETQVVRREVICPHCLKGVIVGVRTTIVKIFTTDVKPEESEDWFGSLPNHKRNLLDVAGTSGVLPAFKAVVARIKGDHTPKNLDKFFLNFLDSTVPLKIPGIVLQKLINAFPRTHIEVRGTQGVAVILSDGMIRGFIGQSILMGQRVHSPGGGGGGMRVRANPREVDDWVRTRYGYVVGKGEMFESMCVRSHGEFNKG